MPFSAWLIPEERHSGQLQELINRLAQENNSPQFAPHCTLVGKIVLDPIFSFAKIKTICMLICDFYGYYEFVWLLGICKVIRYLYGY